MRSKCIGLRALAAEVVQDCSVCVAARVHLLNAAGSKTCSSKGQLFTAPRQLHPL